MGSYRPTDFDQALQAFGEINHERAKYYCSYIIPLKRVDLLLNKTVSINLNDPWPIPGVHCDEEGKLYVTFCDHTICQENGFFEHQLAELIRLGEVTKENINYLRPKSYCDIPAKTTQVKSKVPVPPRKDVEATPDYNIKYIQYGCCNFAVQNAFELVLNREKAAAWDRKENCVKTVPCFHTFPTHGQSHRCGSMHISYYTLAKGLNKKILPAEFGDVFASGFPTKMAIGRINNLSPVDILRAYSMDSGKAPYAWNPMDTVLIPREKMYANFERCPDGHYQKSSAPKLYDYDGCFMDKWINSDQHLHSAFYMEQICRTWYPTGRPGVLRANLSRGEVKNSVHPAIPYLRIAFNI